DLGVYLAAAGRSGEALAAIEEAVVFYRSLATVDASTHGPGLVKVLHNLGVRLAAVGRPVEAVAATDEAKRRAMGAG
ncbi:hypothetical protein LUR56_40920, partial [Streptomyces sp. MT29]|nr:hypothetical protein [Streptomyces sp. MT29]